MTTRLAALGAALALLPGLSPDSASGADLERGRVLSESERCQGCHSETGDSDTPTIPKLAGQRADYLLKQLRDFKSGERKHQIMTAMAADIADADLADIAAWFASQEVMRGDRAEDSQHARTLYLHGDTSRNIPACASCHGVDGKGIAKTATANPVIGGQHRKYLLGQLIGWSLAERTNSPGGVMNQAVQSLSTQEITALSTYISGL